MEDGIEKKILEEMCVRLVANKSEIMNFIIKSKGEVASGVINSITKSLVQKGLLIEVYSSTRSFAITQKGIKQSKMLSD